MKKRQLKKKRPEGVLHCEKKEKKKECLIWYGGSNLFEIEQVWNDWQIKKKIEGNDDDEDNTTLEKRET